jgi:spore germination cell wall hydrolase CwlJ-like protein
MITTIACLATAIYFEARGEPMVGQVAVAQVIINRVYDERFPDTVCEVVKQGEYYTWKPQIPIKHRCQFSFWCDGKDEIMHDKKAEQWAYNVAESVMVGALYDTTEGATHYHADYVIPDWSTNINFTKTVQINAHIFYRWEN